MHDCFEDVHLFLEGPHLPPATSAKLITVLNDQPQCRKLKMELAIMVDSMLPFVKATYLLEGDGPLALTVYQCLSELDAHIVAEHYPNVEAVARRLSNGDAIHKQQLVAYAKNCVVGAYGYYKEKFEIDLKSMVAMFKAARYFIPSKVDELQQTPSDIEKLKAFPFFGLSRSSIWSEGRITKIHCSL